MDIKEKYNQRKYAISDMVAQKIKRKLELSGIKDEKVIMQIIDKHTSHLKREEFVGRMD